MPVPLPSAADELLVPPDPAEVAHIWRALVTAVGGGPEGLSPLQELLLASMTRALTGVRDLAPYEPMPPALFAEKLERRNLAVRERICQVMMLGILVRQPPDVEAMARLSEFCAELCVDGQLMEITSRFADQGLDLAVADFQRLGHLGDVTAVAPRLGRDGEPSALESVWESVEDDPRLVARWRDLGALDPATVGRAVHDFYVARGFAFPGSPGSAAPLLAQHDWVHVVADYGTALESELEVFGYIARANDDARAFSLLAMVVSLFESGAVARGMGLFEADPGHLRRSGMAARLADAMRRGALTAGSHDFMTMDWFEVADRPLAVVRREIGIPPKSEEVVRLGSAGPRDPGGISPFQLEAGRAAAAAEGRPYVDPRTA